jgi:hypothetical protein
MLLLSFGMTSGEMAKGAIDKYNVPVFAMVVSDAAFDFVASRCNPSLWRSAMFVEGKKYSGHCLECSQTSQRGYCAWTHSVAEPWRLVSLSIPTTLRP